MDERIRREILPDVWLTQIQSEKFKTCYMSLSLLRPLSREDAPKNALLPRVLSRGTTAYPDMEQLSARMDELYGASVVPVTRKKGETQCVGFAASFIDEDFSDGEKLLEQVTALVGQLLLNPVTQGGRFLPAYVESERTNLAEEVRSLVKDKRGYAVQQLVKTMCAGEPFGVPNNGTLATVEAVTGAKLFRHYTDITVHSRVEIFFCGGAEFDRLADVWRAALDTLGRGPVAEVFTEKGPMPAAVREEAEETEGGQSILTMGFRTDCTLAEKDYPALVLMDGVFGGDTTSKLFQNVRERLSLCYYASSFVMKHKGLLLVTSGVDPKNEERARDEILAQFEAVRAGDISDEELEGARRSSLASLRAVQDAPGLLEDFYLTRAIEGLDYDPAFLMGELEKVTRDDVVRAAQKTQLDTVFLLRGSEV